MIRKIAMSTATFAGGPTQQDRIFAVPSGPFQGRTAVVYLKTSSHLVLAWADPPLTDWSEEITIASDAADYPVSGVIDEDGNIYVAYSVQTSLDLLSKKLSFSNGEWTPGSAVTVFDGDSNFYPSIFKDSWDQLWITWTREAGGVHYIQSKLSADDGVSWGGGPSDPGLQVNTGNSYAFSRLNEMSSTLHCIYCNGDDGLFMRRRGLGAVLWNSEEGVYSGSGIGRDFDCRVSPDQKLGVVFADAENLSYKEFDGSSWSGAYPIDSTFAVGPRLLFSQTKPFVVYGVDIGGGKIRPVYSLLDQGAFAPPASVSSELDTLQYVLCHRPDAAVQYDDKSFQAANDTVGDVVHDDSGCLAVDSGDAVFFGQTGKFTRLQIELSAIGAGGDIDWYFWTGSDWEQFVPASGAYRFESSPETVILWQDSSGIPAKWQSATVAERSAYWVKAVVSSDFTSGPIGTQISSTMSIGSLT